MAGFIHQGSMVPYTMYKKEYSYPIILTKVVPLSDSLALFVCIAYQPLQGANTFPNHLRKGHLMRISFKDANSSHRSISVAFLILKVLQRQLLNSPLLSLYLFMIKLCWGMFSQLEKISKYQKQATKTEQRNDSTQNSLWELFRRAWVIQSHLEIPVQLAGSWHD